jgi:hypothetical protein
MQQRRTPLGVKVAKSKTENLGANGRQKNHPSASELVNYQREEALLPTVSPLAFKSSSFMFITKAQP